MLLIGAALLQQIHEGAQLQAWDVGPAAAPLHFLEQVEQVVAVGGEAVAEGTVLDGAVEVLQLPQQGQQGFRVVAELLGQAIEPVEQAVEVLLLSGREHGF